MTELVVGIQLKADGSGLVGEVRLSKEELARLEKQTDQVGRSGKKAATGMDEFSRSGKRANGISSGLNSVLKSTAVRYLSVAAATTAVVLSLKKAVSVGAEFSQQMANVASVAGASARELDQLSDAAREQAKVSIFSAREAAQAQYFLASAGLEVNEVISAQSGIMSLAAATQSDLAQTSEITTATLAQFTLHASESARVANVYAASISGSQATLQKLGDAMRYVGPVAKSLDIDLESATAAMSLLFNAGFRGEQVGTALRVALVSLSKPSKEAASRIEEMGLKINDASGRFIGFESLIRQLTESQFDLNTAATLFGTEAAPAMLALVRSGASEFTRMKSAITDTDKAAEMAAQQTDTLNGKWKLLKSAAEELSITLSSRLDPALGRLTQSFTKMINAMAGGARSLSVLRDELEFYRLRGDKGMVSQLTEEIDDALVKKGGVGGLRIELRRLQDQISDTENQMEQYKGAAVGSWDWSKMQELKPKLDSLKKQYGTLFNALAEIEFAADNTSESLSAMGDNGSKSVDKLNDALSKINDEQQSLLDRLFPEDAEFRSFNNDLNELARIFNNDFQGEGYKQALERLTEQHLGLNEVSEEGSKNLKKLADESDTQFTRMEAATRGWGDQFTNTVADVFQKGKGGFSDMVDSFINDLMRVMIYQNITQPLFSSLGIPGFTAPVAHTGGIIGTGDVGATRTVPMGVFAGAKKYHTGGIAGDEVPAILRKKEGVFTEGQMKAMGVAINDGGQTGDVKVIIQNEGQPIEAQGAKATMTPEGLVLSIFTRDLRRGGPMSNAFASTFGLRRSGG